jgi:NO-binding membrane sensor protein with MHYT domain
LRWFAVLVGLIISAIGILGMAAPTVLLDATRFAQTQVGLYVAAAVRVAFGVALIGAAAASRMPRTLRIAGAVVVVAGIITPFFGVERTQAILDWWSAQGTAFTRTWAAFALIFGLFIIYAATPRR